MRNNICWENIAVIASLGINKTGPQNLNFCFHVFTILNIILKKTKHTYLFDFVHFLLFISV